MRPDYRVLIVDDQLVNVVLLEKILQAKYRLATAMSGEEALKILPEFRPDLILLDIMMPGIDGYEVCRRIRKEERFRFIKIIMVSAKTKVDERLKGYEVGADDYITKPFIRKELEAKIKVFSRLKREEELSQLKGDLMMLFSHETKTPLSVIIGRSDILLQNDSLNPDVKKHLSTISSRAYQLLDFVGKTSLLCVLKSGAEPHKTLESAAGQMRDSLTTMEEKASQKKIIFDVDIKDDLEFDADWVMFCKAIIYVLDNSIKFSPEGGTVKIWAGLTAGAYEIRISDSGDGIIPEWHDKVFDEFAIRNIMHHQKGQGLSLAICKYIMALHDGAIRVESAPGKGATFILSMPFS